MSRAKLHEALKPPLATDRSLGIWRLSDIQSTKQSCRFCEFLSQIVEHPHQSLAEDEEIESIYLEAGAGDKEPGCRIFVRGAATAGIIAMFPAFDDIARGFPLGTMARLVIPLYGRPIAETADWALLRAWLSYCCSHHEHRSHSEIRLRDEPLMEGFAEPDMSDSRQSKSQFRLVDVRNMCVVEAIMAFRYACLSYVWGEAKHLSLNSGNFDELTSIWGPDTMIKLPQAFIDTIHIAENLGIDFVWIDALCIQQDDNDDMSHQIGSMDAIYEHAEFTIVSVTSNANCAVPSVSPGSRFSGSIHYEDNSLQLMYARPTFAQATQHSDWETRGWTLQEKYFSKRILFFTEHQVYFQCSDVVWAEDTVIEPTDFERIYFAMLEKLRESRLSTKASQGGSIKRGPVRSASRRKTKSKTLDWKYIYDYQDLLKEYTSRHLTRDVDILAAFSGILNSLSVGLGYHLFGLPEEVFDIVLLWQWQQHKIVPRRKQFPSWSWCGWQSEQDMGLDWLVASSGYKHFSWRISDEGSAVPVNNTGLKIPQAQGAGRRDSKSVNPLAFLAINGRSPSHILELQAHVVLLWIGPTQFTQPGKPSCRLYFTPEEMEGDIEYQNKRSLSLNLDGSQPSQSQILQAARLSGAPDIGQIFMAKEWREKLPDHYQGQFIVLSGSRHNETWYKRRHGTYDTLAPLPRFIHSNWTPTNWNLMLIETDSRGFSERIQVCSLSISSEEHMQRLEKLKMDCRIMLK